MYLSKNTEANIFFKNTAEKRHSICSEGKESWKTKHGSNF
jgi:hypothetical protein